jgi:hypothetical protein
MDNDTQLMTLNIMTLSIMTLTIMTLTIMTLFLTTLGVATLSLTILYINRLGIMTHQNDNQHINNNEAFRKALESGTLRMTIKTMQHSSYSRYQ